MKSIVSIPVIMKDSNILSTFSNTSVHLYLLAADNCSSYYFRSKILYYHSARTVKHGVLVLNLFLEFYSVQDSTLCSILP